MLFYRLYQRLPFGETPPHTHLKHHRARAFHACSQGLRVRYGYSYRREKEGAEKLRNLPKSQSMRVLGLELWKQVAGSLSSPSASVVFKLCLRASACVEGRENL